MYNSGNITSGGVEFEYKCQSKHGGLLALQDFGHAEYVQYDTDWINCIARHHKAWYEFTTETRRCCIQREDLIVVSGWIKADRWALRCFQSKGESSQFSIVGTVPYMGLSGRAGHSAQYSNSGIPRYSPKFMHNQPPSSSNSVETSASASRGSLQEQVLPSDCVFLSAYIVKRRFIKPHKVKAAAEVPKDDRYDDPEDAIEVTTNPQRHKVLFFCGKHKRVVTLTLCLDRAIRASSSGPLVRGMCMSLSLRDNYVPSLICRA